MTTLHRLHRLVRLCIAPVLELLAALRDYLTARARHAEVARRQCESDADCLPR